MKIEFVLGLLGGIFGFFATIGVLFIGTFAIAFGAIETIEFYIRIVSLFIISILGIIGAALSDNRPKLGGWLMIVSGIINIFVAYILAGALLIIGSIIAIRKR